MQFPADEDILEVTWFFKKIEKVTEHKIPKQGPKTKMQTTGLKQRQKRREKTHANTVRREKVMRKSCGKTDLVVTHKWNWQGKKR